MFDKLEEVEKRFDELTKMISDPGVIANQSEWQQLVKEHSSMQDIVEKYREYKKTIQTIEEAKVRLDKTINFQKENYGYFICLKDTNEPVGFVVIKEVEPKKDDPVSNLNAAMFYYNERNVSRDEAFWRIIKFGFE